MFQAIHDSPDEDSSPEGSGLYGPVAGIQWDTRQPNDPAVYNCGMKGALDFWESELVTGLPGPNWISLPILAVGELAHDDERNNPTRPRQLIYTVESGFSPDSVAPLKSVYGYRITNAHLKHCADILVLWR